MAAAVIRAIHRPLQRLKAGTKAVAGGDLEHRIVITSRDEFADVAAEFNRMVDQLQATTVSRWPWRRANGACATWWRLRRDRLQNGLIYGVLVILWRLWSRYAEVPTRGTLS